MTRYFINMNDGRVIAGTAETPENVNYREIDVSWAIAIRDGRTTASEVVRLVNEKVGMTPYSEWTKAMSRLNVRSRDLGMVRHARAAADAGDGDGGVLGAFEEQKTASVQKKGATAQKKAAASAAEA